MKIVVGLGNPEKKYEGTRHNVGFDLIDELAHRHGAAKPRTKFEADVAEVTIGAERVLLVAPQTYMNHSGRSVRQVVDFYQLAPTDVLIVCDDMNLPLGRLRLRKGGSSGGQKGLANIVQHLGTENVPRLRIGIDPPPAGRNAADYVLDRFSKAEARTMAEALKVAADAVAVWVTQGADVAMNRFNAAQEKAGGNEENSK